MMSPKIFNNILLHVIPNGSSKRAYIQGWYFEGNSYYETSEMLERMVIEDKF